MSTGAWSLNVAGRLFGPFSFERLRSFALEGRFTPDSLVAPEGATDWQEARNVPELTDIFSPPPVSVDRTGGELQRIAATSTNSSAVRSVVADVAESHRTQFAIVVDLKSRSNTGFEKAIASLGPSYQLLPNVWIVSSDQTVNTVRNRLLQEIGKSDLLFVVDATRGKAAWFNFGPEAESRIRRIWQKAS